MKTNFPRSRVVQRETIFMAGATYENSGDERTLALVTGYLKCRYIEYTNIDFFWDHVTKQYKQIQWLRDKLL